MRRRLYARGEKLSLGKRKNLRDIEYDAKNGWRGDDNKIIVKKDNNIVVLIEFIK